MGRRLIYNVGALISIMLFPAWVTLCVLAVMLLTFKERLYEVVVWGSVIDFLYGTYLYGFPYVPIIYTFIATALLLVAEFLKPRLMYYDRI